jgi:hypothetical protein
MPSKPNEIVKASTSEHSVNSVLASWEFGDSDGGNAIRASTIHVFHADDLITELRSIDVQGVENTHVIDGLEENTAYAFRVSVANHLFQSEPSDFVDFQTQGPPSAPIELDIVNVGSDSVELNWAKPFDGHSEITSYSLYVRLGDNILDDVVDQIDSTNFVYEAEPATEYSFTVAAINARGESNESAFVKAMTISRSPNAPTNVAVVDATTTSLTV